MQRNNLVFLFGQVAHYTTRNLQVDGEMTLMMEIELQTDKVENGGCHKVYVTGQQAREVQHFLVASEGESLELTVLGWLHSHQQSAVVMAGRVTAVAPKAIKRTAIEAIRRDTRLLQTEPKNSNT